MEQNQATVLVFIGLVCGTTYLDGEWHDKGEAYMIWGEPCFC